MATKQRNAHFKHVVGLAGDALFDTVVASVSYAFEVRAQMIEDLEELKTFLLREEEDDEDDDEEP
jgi:hypothetical protein